MAMLCDYDLLTAEQRQKLVKLLTMQPQVENKRAPPPQPLRFYIKSGCFLAMPYYIGAGIVNTWPCGKWSLADFQFSDQLHPEQEEVSEEALTLLKRRRTAILSLPTAFGKTVIAIWLACQLGLRTLVVVHRRTLRRQWMNSFRRRTNATIAIVGVDQIVPESQVIVSTVGQLRHISAQVRVGVGFLIIDEAHRFATKSNGLALLRVYPKHILALTATLHREDKMHQMVHAICGPRIIWRPMTRKVHIRAVFTSFSPPYGGSNWAKMQHWLCQHSERNQLILKLVTSLPQAKIVIFSALEDYVTVLHTLLRNADVDASKYSGKDESYKNARVLVSTYSKIMEGFDEEGACDDFDGQRIDTVIFTSSFKNSIRLHQSIGRARTDTIHVIDIIDNHGILLHHWRKRCAQYQQLGATIERVKMD